MSIEFDRLLLGKSRASDLTDYYGEHTEALT
jgi:hypothetical protein